MTYADGVDASLLQRTSLLSDWLSTINPDWVITKCTVMSVDVWPSGVVGFLELDVTYSIGSNIHNERIIIAGGSVSAALIVKCSDDGQYYTVLVRQPRIGSGKLTLEYPAGMTDGSSDYRGTAIRELQEEVGICVTDSELIDVSELLGTKYFHVFGERFDEHSPVFLVKREMTRDELKSFEGKECGADEDEQIVVRVVPFGKITEYPIDGTTAAATFAIEFLNLVNAV